MKKNGWVREGFALLAVAAMVMVMGMGEAHAGAVIVSGDIALGVNDEGHLNVVNGTDGISAANASAVGIAFKGIDGSFLDATSPGCLCEGWGVSGSGASGYANISVDGEVNLTVDSFTSDGTTITSRVHLTSFPELSVTQAYSASAGAPGVLFENKVTITNTGANAITDLRYVRVMDWDVPLTEFAEFVTIQGTGTTADLEKSHDNGFNTANPLGDDFPIDPATVDADFVDNGPNDHGAYFRFNFGDLAAGASKEFSIFYGAAGTEAAVLAALGTVGIELYSLGQSNPPSGDPSLGTPATYVFGFKGVGGTIIVPPPGGAPVPEPGTLLLLGSGLIGLVVWRKRKQA